MTNLANSTSPLVGTAPQTGPVVNIRWGDFQNLITVNALAINFAESDQVYVVMTTFGSVVYACTLFKPAFSAQTPWPADYSQAQNDADAATFLSSFYQLANVTAPSKVLNVDQHGIAQDYGSVLQTMLRNQTEVLQLLRVIVAKL